MKEQEYVIIRFTGEISIYVGTLLSALEDDIYNDYSSTDSRCGYSVFPKSPEISKEVRIWSPNIKRLCRTCCQAIYELEVKLGKEIPFEIKIEGDE